MTAKAMLKGLDKLVSQETGMPVHIIDEPLRAVARGTGIMLEDQEKLRKVLASSRRAKQ
jgi:rod shape-determining protein MreB